MAEKEAKITELKKANKKSEDQFKKLTVEKNSLEESLKAEVRSYVLYVLLGYISTITQILYSLLLLSCHFVAKLRERLYTVFVTDWVA